MTKPNLTLLLIIVAAVLVAVIAVNNSCNNSTAGEKKYQDSIAILKHLNSTLAYDYGKQHESDSIRIVVLSKDADTLRTGYTYWRGQAIDKGTQLLATNQRYKEARAQLDTVLALARCDSLSVSLDSTAQLVWNAGRKVDSLLFVNDDLKNAQDTALIHARTALAAKNSYIDNLSKLYDAAHKDDLAELAKVKRQAKTRQILPWGVAAVLTVLLAVKK